jgi:hypothetical protein
MDGFSSAVEPLGSRAVGAGRRAVHAEFSAGRHAEHRPEVIPIQPAGTQYRSSFAAGWTSPWLTRPCGPWSLAADEFVIAGLLLAARRTAYLAVVAPHLALMLFGWGFALWCLPALAFAVPAAVRSSTRRAADAHPHALAEIEQADGCKSR